MNYKLICIDGLYVCSINGKTFMSDAITSQQRNVLLNDPTEEEVIEIFNPKLKEILEENESIKITQDILLKSGLFEVKNNAYFRKGNPISVPRTLLNRYVTYLNEGRDTTPLDNFWVKCSLNPDHDAREDLFWFLDKWGFVITPKGYFVAYRNAELKQEDNRKLHDFIALNYTKVRGWKKAPKNYNVYFDEYKDEYRFVENTIVVEDIKLIGNLQDLYSKLGELCDTVYTDSYSHSTRIQIGIPVSYPREKCQTSNQVSCDRGLHVGGAQWLKKGYFGNQGLIVLVNPTNVTSVPVVDNYGKLRCCEYQPVGLIEYDEQGNVIPIEVDIFEDDYERHSIGELNKLLSSINPSGQKIHTLEIKSINGEVFTSMEEYRELLSNKTAFLYDEDDEQFDEEEE